MIFFLLTFIISIYAIDDNKEFKSSEDFEMLSPSEVLSISDSESSDSDSETDYEKQIEELEPTNEILSDISSDNTSETNDEENGCLQKLLIWLCWCCRRK